jgi:hypothetical protein
VESIQIIRLALGVISDRLITIVALLSSCGLTCYTLWAGGWERVATLAIYVIFAYLTVGIKEKSNAIHSKSENN